MIVLFLLLLKPTDDQSLKVNASYTTLIHSLSGIPHHCVISLLLLPSCYVQLLQFRRWHCGSLMPPVCTPSY